MIVSFPPLSGCQHTQLSYTVHSWSTEVGKDADSLCRVRLQREVSLTDTPRPYKVRVVVMVVGVVMGVAMGVREFGALGGIWCRCTLSWVE